MSCVFVLLWCPSPAPVPHNVLPFAVRYVEDESRHQVCQDLFVWQYVARHGFERWITDGPYTHLHRCCYCCCITQ